MVPVSYAPEARAAEAENTSIEAVLPESARFGDLKTIKCDNVDLADSDVLLEEYIEKTAC